MGGHPADLVPLKSDKRVAAGSGAIQPMRGMMRQEGGEASTEPSVMPRGCRMCAGGQVR